MILKTAVVQLNSSEKIKENLKLTDQFVRQAAEKGAHYILTPENTHLMSLDKEYVLKHAEPEGGGPACAFFSKLAKEHKVWLHIGSMATRLKAPKKGTPALVNRSFVFAPDGRLAKTYDKIHMFDVQLPDGETYTESTNYRAGERAELVETKWGKIGLSICYDLRFAHLYRLLAQKGAKILTIPAAFTQQTGKAHWHILLRARAIETGSFVLAAAQVGTHDGGRQTYGHSLIISPWGDILAEADGSQPGVIMGELDLSFADKARRAIPAIHNIQNFKFIDEY